MKTYKFLNIIFYIFLSINAIVFFLPPEYKMGVYTPNLMAMMVLFVILPLTLLLFIILFVFDIKKHLKENLIKRNIIFFIVFLLCLIYGIYQAYMNGNFYH
tara:strand:+ start:4051 stop:4353 length:303 start_codon:yes stop_codon:yes gene_type:complete